MTSGNELPHSPPRSTSAPSSVYGPVARGGPGTPGRGRGDGFALRALVGVDTGLCLPQNSRGIPRCPIGSKRCRGAAGTVPAFGLVQPRESMDEIAGIPAARKAVDDLAAREHQEGRVAVDPELLRDVRQSTSIHPQCGHLPRELVPRQAQDCSLGTAVRTLATLESDQDRVHNPRQQVGELVGGVDLRPRANRVRRLEPRRVHR